MNLSKFRNIVEKRLEENPLKEEGNFYEFLIENQDLKEEFSSEIEYFREHVNEWKSDIREIKHWKDLDIRSMYNRLIQLSERYSSKGNPFQIVNEIGTFSIPDRLSILNKIRRLADTLIFEILPEIENNVNFSTETIRIEDNIIKGKIDWNTTILNSIKHGEKTPLTFTCFSNKIEFDTPENKLAVLCLLKLEKDAELLLTRRLEKGELNNKEFQILLTITDQADLFRNNSKLKSLFPLMEQYAFLSINSKAVRDLERFANERMNQGVIRQQAYFDLLKWLENYRGNAVETIDKNYWKFPLRHEKSLDILYEMWVLFEMIAFLDSQGVEIRPLEKGKFSGFKIRILDTDISLRYQPSYFGWTDVKSEPDFTFEIGNDVPIIMDPKNWFTPAKGEAIHKMHGYLHSLYPKKASVGILFFSSPPDSHKQEGKVNPIVEKHYKIGNIKTTFLTFVLNIADKNFNVNRKLIFDRIFEELKKRITITIKA